MQIKIYKFVCKDNRQNPYILTLSDTLLGILQNQTLTMNLEKDIQSNRPFCTETKYRIKQTSWVKLKSKPNVVENHGIPSDLSAVSS